MAKASNVFTRVDPLIKEQAESVLNGLGLSMATAMEAYLRQIAYQRKIPFEMALPTTKPIVYNDLSESEFNALMDKAMKQYADGKCMPIQDFEDQLAKEFGV